MKQEICLAFKSFFSWRHFASFSVRSSGYLVPAISSSSSRLSPFGGEREGRRRVKLYDQKGKRGGKQSECLHSLPPPLITRTNTQQPPFSLPLSFYTTPLFPWRQFPTAATEATEATTIYGGAGFLWWLTCNKRERRKLDQSGGGGEIFRAF